MDLARGLHPWDAVIDATLPVCGDRASCRCGFSGNDSDRVGSLLGPMAYAIIGGLFVATLLTLLFLPALYIAWFRIKEPRKEPEPRLEAGVPAAAE